ncbi:hypothetical protein CHELA1G2_12874 [Hyphomicrobiales bacterium]|nr:hypothetical protein CHELA1G2_12874 [Hyphomicrobiales bacterium]
MMPAAISVKNRADTTLSDIPRRGFTAGDQIYAAAAFILGNPLGANIESSRSAMRPARWCVFPQVTFRRKLIDLLRMQEETWFILVRDANIKS